MCPVTWREAKLPKQVFGSDFDLVDWERDGTQVTETEVERVEDCKLKRVDEWIDLWTKKKR